MTKNISIDYGIAADAHYDLEKSEVVALIPAIEAKLAEFFPDADIDVSYVDATGAAGGAKIYIEDASISEEGEIAQSVSETVYAMIEAASIAKFA